MLFMKVFQQVKWLNSNKKNNKIKSVFPKSKNFIFYNFLYRYLFLYLNFDKDTTYY